MEISAFDTLVNTPVEEYCANDSGFRQMLRLMDINAYRRELASNNFGSGMSGVSNQVSPEVYDYDYSYTDKQNYLKNYQMEDAKNGTTNPSFANDNFQNYIGNRLYGATTNAYYDDNDTGDREFTSERKTKFYQPNNKRLS